MEGYSIKEGQTDVVWVGGEPYRLGKLNPISDTVLNELKEMSGKYPIIALGDELYLLERIER